MIHCIYHGHSFVEIQSAQGSILIDPYISKNRLCDISLHDIIEKNIIAICLSHGHDDHVGDTLTIAQAKPDLPIIAMYELSQRLLKQGATHTLAINIGGRISLNPDTHIKYVRADHSNSTPDGMYAGLAAGIVITIQHKTIYHAGDTALYQDMKEISSGSKIDCAFVPIGDRFTMGLEDSVKAVGLIKADTVVPIHYNTRPSIQVPELQRATQIMQDTSSIPKVLHPGQYIVLSD